MDCIALASFTHTHPLPQELSTAIRLKTAILRKCHRLGAANCLKGLADVALRQGHPNGAKSRYQEALAAFRDIGDRLGAASCLNGLGAVALAQNNLAVAFKAFRDAHSAFQAIGDRLGQQKALAYLAECAESGRQTDQALLLAELSLTVGRAIADRSGQQITLGLQLHCLAKLQDVAGVLATALIMESLGLPLPSQLAEILGGLPQEIQAPLRADPESFRLRAVQEARERFTASERDLWDPPPPSGG